MLVYSENINKFLTRLRKHTREILKTEAGIDVRKTRIAYQGYLYPINIVCFERENVLGYYDPSSYQIGINKKLIYTAKTKIIKDILRHEIAHFIVHLEHGVTAQAHGEEFKEICKRYGWDKSVSKATIDVNLANEKLEGDLDSEKVISRVKKLLQLASSDNSHEAELATLKANQLLLKHNIAQINSSDDEEVFVKQVLGTKKSSTKHQTIYELLKHFHVAPVFNYTKGQVYLEVTGSKTSVEIAEYVATYLDEQLEEMWKETRKNNPDLKGIKARNSFFRGVATGYNEKIIKTKNEFNSDERKALVKVEQKLSENIKLVYGKTSARYSSAGNDSTASALGREAGKNLSIHKGIKNGKKPGLLSFFRS
jgi:hypothetical protein